MNAKADIFKEYRHDYLRLAGKLPGATVPWLRTLRDAALSRFQALGIPTLRDEDWKYTRLSLLEKQAYPRAAGIVHVEPESLARLPLAGFSPHCMVFVDGYFSPGLSSLAALPPQVTLASLAQVLDNSPEQVGELLEFSPENSDAFHALNSAFMSDGVYLNIPAQCVVDEPIHLRFIYTGAEGAGVYPRIMVRAGAGSRSCIVESHVSLGNGQSLNNRYCIMRLDRDASLQHYEVQLESDKALDIGSTEVSQAAGSRFHSHMLLLGARLMRKSMHVDLAGEGAECMLNGLFFARDRQHHDLHVRIDHRAPRCTSREYFRGLADGHGRGVLDGKVTVHPQAQLSDAQLHSRNLLLSRQAEIDVKPQLEIYADNVKCSHGATVGQLDEDALFYLQARGIEESMARNLAIYAFANEIIDRFTLPDFKKQGRYHFLNIMPQGDQLQGLL